MASIFEKTMQACRESKANAAKKSNATSKKLTEKFASKRIKKESEDEEDFDDEVMMDVQDDIVAVIDPDIDADEMTSVALGFQQLVDDATANEIPETDEYIDQEIYGCPVCGAKFFSEEPMIGAGKCPVCGEEAEGFVLVGEVDNAEGTEDSEDKSDDEEKSDDSEISGEEDFDIEIKADEKKKPIKGETKRIRRAVRGENRRSVRKPMRRESARRVSRLNVDESTFNGPLTKFVRENYENARSMRVVGARLKGNVLTLECVATFKSGKKSKISLECKYDRNSKIMLAKDSGAFKTESKKAPFMFKINTRAGVIRCEEMKYNFTTTTKIQNESKKVRVHGTCMAESRSVARRSMARRAVESRRAIRRPVARKVTESRRIVRRPMTRRTTESRRLATRRAVRPMRSESRRVVRKPMTRRAESVRAARRVRPSVRATESRRNAIARRVTGRAVESRRLARRPSRSMRAESTRVRRPVAKRASLRTESRIARRNAITRRTRR